MFRSSCDRAAGQDPRRRRGSAGSPKDASKPWRESNLSKVLSGLKLPRRLPGVIVPGVEDPLDSAAQFLWSSERSLQVPRRTMYWSEEQGELCSARGPFMLSPDSQSDLQSLLSWRANTSSSRSGRCGAGSSWRCSVVKLKPAVVNHGCSRTSVASPVLPSRRRGLMHSSFFMKSLTGAALLSHGRRPGGTPRSWLRRNASICPMGSSLSMPRLSQGPWPVSNSKVKTPRAHQSTPMSCACGGSIISGAM
mmetsp:Transcript_4996/g.12864  ORF Transcript_4996/g.12864 Transcript_4996/m.12864 type:complete len:250 (+) Transcript_4996:176-925(+)